MAVPAVRLQPRDLRFLAELADVGLMDTNMTHSRYFPQDRSRKACERRLRLLTSHTLIQPLKLGLSYADRHAGRLPTIYRITAEGAELLANLTGEKPKRVSRRDPHPAMLLHRLGVARTRLIVNDACGLHHLPRPVWIGEYDCVPGSGPEAKLADRFILCERFSTTDGGHHICWADASCVLQISGQTPAAAPQSHPLILYWEYDRSTETLAQVARKVPGYHQLLATGVNRKHWPQILNPTVRIFFVLQSVERLQNVAEATKDLPAAEYIRLTTVQDLTAHHFLAAPIWRTTRGESRSILRTSPPSSSNG